jgi:dihydroorotate dehydrogenase electron transfer subunit
MVAGGVGIVPLAFLTWENDAVRETGKLLMGAASSKRMPDLDALLPDGLRVAAATDDGSSGHHGFVTDLIAENADAQTTVLTCGPHGMMARVAELTAEAGLTCFASLENHMACGFGACVGCTVEFRDPEREDRRYRRVCLEGPVVNAHQIVW